jgi:phosphotransferase system HPr (HPr) family protein
LGLKQDNAFGSGNSLGVQINTSKINRVLDFSTTDPYFTPDGVSRTLSVYHKTFSPYQDQSYYQLVSSGGTIRFGVPFSESDTVYFGGGIENTTIVNKLGLHARASAKLTKLAGSFPCEVWLSKGERRVNAKSIMGVMMLAAGMGSHVTLETVGDQEQEAMQALLALMADKFGEGE